MNRFEVRSKVNAEGRRGYGIWDDEYSEWTRIQGNEFWTAVKFLADYRCALWNNSPSAYDENKDPEIPPPAIR